MDSNRKQSVSRVLSRTSRFIYTILGGSLIVYLAVVVKKVLVFYYSLPLSVSEGVLAGMFSSYVLPLLIGQGIFFLAVYFEWQRKKKALLAAHDEELRQARDEAALESARKVAGFVSEHVTAPNAEILKWIHFRKGQKQQVSERVEGASMSIARAVTALTEFAFVAPHSREKAILAAPALGPTAKVPHAPRQLAKPS